jgi:pantoate--beta-alanine ligase
MSRPRVVTTRAELRVALGDERPRAVVMTMGALHDGHAALLREARTRAGVGGRVVATVFVNPLQFGQGEDLARYPRTFDQDLAVCGQEDVDVVFAPRPEVIYPGPPEVTIDPGPLGKELEGASRPGHFAGVLTVVCKLLHLVGPDVAVFGEKDYQQLVLVRRMVDDLDLPLDGVPGVPTVRESDGLALSSRNRYLSAGQRAAATVLSRALFAGAGAAGEGASAVLATTRGVLAAEPAAAVEYLQLRGCDLGPVPDRGPARLLVAARLGSTRLIDNVPVLLGG